MLTSNYTLREKDKCLLQNAIFFIVLFFVTCFLFWKCRFGYGNIDESFYLTVPYRLYRGDGLFQKEWHLSQMAGFLTLPIVTLYMELKGSTEGIILDMRYIWTLIQCVTAVFLYIRLKHINWLGAAIAAISYVLYTPFGIMAMSYNSLGILFLLLSQVILLTAQRKKHVQYAVAGLSFAAAVLCCPYLLVVYVLYLVAVAVARLKHREKKSILEETPWSIKSAVCFTAGAAALAVVFAVFVFSRGSLQQIISAFPHIFDDPEHEARSLLYEIKRFILLVYLANARTQTIYNFFAILWIVCLLDRKRQSRKTLYICLVAIGVFKLMLCHYQQNHYINHLMWSVNVCAVFFILLSKNTHIRKIFLLFWIPGILYALCLHLTSNQKFYAISSASSVATAGTMLMLGIYINEQIKDHRKKLWKWLTTGCLCVLIVFQIASQAVMRYESVFWEDGMDTLTVKVEEGIEKGLIISERYLADYQLGLKRIQKVSEYEPDHVLYLSRNTWYYLQSNHQMSTFSAWMSGVNAHSLYRLGAYYDINPEKMPDVVYAEPEYEEIAIEFCEQFDYSLLSVDEGLILLPNA